MTTLDNGPSYNPEGESEFHVIPDAGDGQPAIIEVTVAEQLAEARAELKVARRSLEGAVEERDHARARWDEYKRLAEATATDLSEAEAEIARLRHQLGGQ